MADLIFLSPSSFQLVEPSRLHLSSLSLHCGLENLPEQSCEAIVGLTLFLSNTLRSLVSSALKAVVSYIVSVSCLSCNGKINLVPLLLHLDPKKKLVATLLLFTQNILWASTMLNIE